LFVQSTTGIIAARTVEITAAFGATLYGARIEYWETLFEALWHLVLERYVARSVPHSAIVEVLWYPSSWWYTCEGTIDWDSHVLVDFDDSFRFGASSADELEVRVESPVAIVLEDSRGNRTGADAFNVVYGEIPFSEYSGRDSHPQTVRIQGPASNYKLLLYGIEAGEYRLIVTLTNQGNQKHEQSFVGSVSAGDVLATTISIILRGDGRDTDLDSIQPPLLLSSAFRRGDANQDGTVDISDPIASLGFLFLGNPQSLSCMDAADSNDDGQVDLSDAVYTLGHEFLGTPTPPQPGTVVCGLDPTGDELAACSYDATRC
jgi:hypothetical protein